MYCKKCGQAVEGNFCAVCGTPITVETPQIFPVETIETTITQKKGLEYSHSKNERIALAAFSALMIMTILFVPWLKTYDDVNISFLAFMKVTPEPAKAAIVSLIMKAGWIIGLVLNSGLLYTLLITKGKPIPWATEDLETEEIPTAATAMGSIGKFQMGFSLAFLFGVYMLDRAVRGLSLFDETISRTPTSDSGPVIMMQTGIAIYLVLGLAEWLYAKVLARKMTSV